MENGLFHIINRGFEKRKIFLDKEDYLRFADNLKDFNSPEITFLPYPQRRNAPEMTSPKDPKEQIVDILSWSFLPNHFHILTSDRIEKGRSIFARKLTIGYTMYFNLKMDRSGTLFQGRSKIIPVLRDSHFLHLPFYILANPLDLFQFGWKKKGIRNPRKAVEFLKRYPWSAFQNLIRKTDLPGLVNKAVFFDLFETNERRLEKDFLEWLNSYTFDPDIPKFLQP